MKNTRKIIFWLAVILWMGLIFNLSHKPATESNKMSKGITQTIVETLEKIAPSVEINTGRFNNILRKNAHFFAYLILGILVLNALIASGIKSYKAIGFAVLICLLYAISDEIHQLFILGRGGQIKDVIIDSAGAVIGVGISKGRLVRP